MWMKRHIGEESPIGTLVLIMVIKITTYQSINKIKQLVIRLTKDYPLQVKKEKK